MKKITLALALLGVVVASVGCEERVVVRRPQPAVVVVRPAPVVVVRPPVVQERVIVR